MSNPTARGIDPRGPRFAAGMTSVILAVATWLSLTGTSASQTMIGRALAASEGTDGGFTLSLIPLDQRVADAGFVVVSVAAALFLWGVASPRSAPWGAVYRALVAPRLAPPKELEDPRPPRFAQGVGLAVTVIGLILHVVGVPLALVIAAALAFVAAFLNAVFGFCLGCEMYLILQRTGLVGRARTA